MLDHQNYYIILSNYNRGVIVKCTPVKVHAKLTLALLTKKAQHMMLHLDAISGTNLRRTESLSKAKKKRERLAVGMEA